MILAEGVANFVISFRVDNDSTNVASQIAPPSSIQTAGPFPVQSCVKYCTLGKLMRPQLVNSHLLPSAGISLSTKAESLSKLARTLSFPPFVRRSVPSLESVLNLRLWVGLETESLVVSIGRFEPSALIRKAFAARGFLALEEASNQSIETIMQSSFR